MSPIYPKMFTYFCSGMGSGFPSLFLLAACRDFPVRLENPHVISDNQIWAGAVPVGPSGYTFNSSYRTRDSIEYKQELGNAIGMWNVMLECGVYAAVNF